MDKFKAIAPEKHEYEMNIIMSLDDWKKVRSQIMEKEPYWTHPVRRLTDLIDDMVNQAEKVYWPDK